MGCRFASRYIRTCKFCGEPFLALMWHIKRGRAKFCSKPCSDKARRKHGFIKYCLNCSKQLKVMYSGRFRKFCDITCSNIYRGKQCKENGKRYKNESNPRLSKRDGHRKIAEIKLGRKLKKGETVHHIDNDSTNNSPDNLDVLANRKIHIKAHWSLHALLKDLLRKKMICYQNGEYHLVENRISIRDREIKEVAP